MLPPRNNLSVLLVESDRFAREEMTAFLSRAVTKVLLAENGQAALTLFLKERPDIIITDLVLPLMDGLEFIGKVRDENEDVPILVTFDGYNPSSLIKALQHNIAGFLHKPVDDENMYKQLWRVAKEVLLRQKLHETRAQLERILDFFPANVVLVNNETVSFINQKFLSFLGYDSYLNMLEESASLDTFILDINGSSYEGSSGDWLHMILNDPLDRDQMVRMTNPRHSEDEGRTFILSFNEFNKPGMYLFVFSDVSELQDDRIAFEDQASIDPLTGALNRRRFLELLAVQEMYMATSGRSLSLIMFDIDHFKLVNDNHGHDVGDSVLREICTLARSQIRDNDRLARWGGEEFMVLMDGAQLRQARTLAERLRKAVEAYTFTGLPGGCTSSFGVAQWLKTETRAAFLKRVDEALYRAKESGRNKVVVG